MKRCITGMIRATAFCVILIGMLIFLNNLLREKWYDNATLRDEGYKALPSGVIDALFIGSSHNYYTVSPSVVMEETGISTYVLGSPALRLNMAYEALLNALKTQNPQAVLLEAYSFSYNSRQTDAYMHYTFDNIPLSWDKWQGVLRTTEEEQTELRKELMIPLMLYHTRWNELTKDDLKYALGMGRTSESAGQALTAMVVEDIRLDGSMLPGNAAKEVTKENREAFERIKALCDEKGIRLILWKATTPRWSGETGAFVRACAQQMGVPYYDLNDPELVEEMGIDTATDFADQGHLNVSGSLKNSRMLSRVLLAEGVQGHMLSEKEKTQWQACGKNFQKVYGKWESQTAKQAQ